MRKIIPLLTLSLLALSCQKPEQKPNVLFIAVDDLRPELNCYGADYIHSPNLDQLATEGYLFTNHYVSVPTCGASRFSLLTGNYPVSIVQAGNEACHREISGKPETERPETWVHQLRRNGYYTIGIGKISHYVDGLLYGYTDSVGTEYELPHSWDEMLFDPGKWGTGWNAFFGYADGENRQSLNRQVKPWEAAPVEDTGYPDGLTTQLAIKKLQELSEVRGSKFEVRSTKFETPFLLAIGYFKPHLPFNAPQKYWDLYDEDSLPLSPVPFIPEGISKASLHGSGEFNGYKLGDEQASLEGPVSEEYARKLRHAYAACVSYIDAQIGMVLDELERLGLDENTHVIIWGDHGWHLGDQLVWGKHTIFDYATRSTLFILPKNEDLRPKTQIRPKTQELRHKIDAVVGTVDLYPTIMELCGVEMPYVGDGESLVPLMENPDMLWEDAKFSYFNRGISLRTERYRLTKYFREQEPTIELFDHFEDPYESRNVAKELPQVVDSLLAIYKTEDLRPKTEIRIKK